MGLRPNTVLNDPRTGWNTVHVRRNDVPDQNASMADPLSFFAITYAGQSVTCLVYVDVEQHTGSATEMLVASKAAIKDTTLSEPNAT